MKIAVLGATGPSGLEVVKEGLARHHEIVALVRNPEKLGQAVADCPLLKVHQVDILNEKELSPHLEGCDAVLSCLGGRGGIFTPCSIYTDTIGPIVSAVRAARVSRLICMTAWGTKDDPGLPWIIRWVLRPLFLRNVLPNMAAMEDWLADNASDLEYTVVRPPRLLLGPATGRKVLAAEGLYVEGGSRGINRSDVARFMLDITQDGQWKRKCVAVDISPM